jgi:hypothetical protein
LQTLPRRHGRAAKEQNDGKNAHQFDEFGFHRLVSRINDGSLAM